MDEVVVVSRMRDNRLMGEKYRIQRTHVKDIIQVYVRGYSVDGGGLYESHGVDMGAEWVECSYYKTSQKKVDKILSCAEVPILITRSYQNQIRLRSEFANIPDDGIWNKIRRRLIKKQLIKGEFLTLKAYASSFPQYSVKHVTVLE